MVDFRPRSVEINYAEIGDVERKSGKKGKKCGNTGFLPTMPVEN